MLSSLVINPPYKIDGYTSSPKVSKTLTLPFGIRLTSALLSRLALRFTFSMSLFMALSCICLTCLNLPIEKQNNSLISSAKSLTNEKYYLLQELQETSSLSKLFSNAESNSLKDAEQVIYAKSAVNNTNTKQNKLIAINKYPSIQFSGF